VADNAPGHTIHLDDFCSSCFSATKHDFTHSAYDQGVTANFKACYLCTTFAQALAATQESGMTL
jgi:hypothetical protein